MYQLIDVNYYTTCKKIRSNELHSQKKKKKKENERRKSEKRENVGGHKNAPAGETVNPSVTIETELRVGSSINLCCYDPSKSSNVRFYTGMTVSGTILAARSSEEWQDTVPVIDACQSRKPAAARSSAVKLRRRKKKYACVHTQIHNTRVQKGEDGDGNCQGLPPRQSHQTNDPPQFGTFSV